jgi:uncharacterized membrane protein YukC
LKAVPITKNAIDEYICAYSNVHEVKFVKNQNLQSILDSCKKSNTKVEHVKKKLKKSKDVLGGGGRRTPRRRIKRRKQEEKIKSKEKRKRRRKKKTRRR